MPFASKSVDLDTIRQQNRLASILLDCIDIAIDNIDPEVIITELSKLHRGQKLVDVLPKLDLEFKEEIRPSVVSLVKKYQKDRSFKLDTIKIGEFSREHDKKLQEATIHIGMTADEYARNFNALALTIGRDIFFRNGAYKPETEEGRKLLAHELTHVSQNENKEETRYIEKEDLEKQAILEEKAEANPENKKKIYKIMNREYKLTAKQIKEIEDSALVELEEWIFNQEKVLSEEAFLDLLLKYEKYEVIYK